MPQQVDIVIEGATVVTVDAERRIVTDALVAVDGGEIVAVGKLADLRDAYEPKERIDGRDRVVLPGFVNGHRHLIEFARGLIPDDLVTKDWLKHWCYPYLGHITPEHERAGALNVIADMLLTGTTTVVDPGVKFPETTFEVIGESGIRAISGIWTWDHMGPDAQKCAPHFFATSTDEALAKTEETIARFDGAHDGRLRVWATLEGVGTCSDRLMAEARELAEQRGVSVLMHKASSIHEAEMEQELYGRRPIEHMLDIGALGPNVYLNHMTAVSKDEVPILAETDTKVCENPSAAFKLAKGTSQMGEFVAMMEAGVNVNLGCDGSNSSDFSDMTRAMYLAATLPNDQYMDPSRMSAEQAIEMATINGARAIGQEDLIGSVEVGKRADLVIFDTRCPEWAPTFDVVNVLVYSASGASVETVLVDGRVVVRERRTTLFDQDAAVREIQRLRPDVLKTAGLTHTSRWPIV